MVRAVAFLFILTVFTRPIMGSILGQFSSSEQKDKTKMLQYLRGMLKLDTTTVKANVIKRADRWIPTGSTVRPEQIWDSQPSTDTRDKSKMLAYLRGIKSPRNKFNVYEVPTVGPVQSIQNADENQNAETLNTENDQQLLINLDKSGDTEPRVLWENAGATQVTFLQPAEKDKDSGTCFWRGQQSSSADLGVDPYGSRVSLKNAQPYDIEDVGENISAAWECAKKKFWISYDKIKKKVCSMFQSDSDNEADTKKGTDTSKGAKKGHKI